MNILTKLRSLLNQHSYTQSEQFIKDKIITANIIMLVMGPSVFFFSMYRYINNEYIQSAIDLVLVAVIIIGFFLLSKSKNNLLLVSRMLMFFAIVVALIVIVRIPDLDTRFSWLSLSTYFIFYLLGAKEGRVWFVTVLSLLTLLFLFGIIKISVLEFVVFCSVNTILAFFLFQYEKIKEQSEYILLNYTKNLETAVEEKTRELQKQKEILESEVTRRTNELIIANRAKGDFLANMSHEIRTPLNAILGFIRILKKDEDDPKKRKHFDVVDTSGKTLLTIINDILDFSKIENGKLNIENTPFNIQKAFEDVYALFYEKAKEKEISLSLEIAKTIPVNVLGDEVRVKQIISNILSNAIKFTQVKGDISITVSYDKVEETLSCSIKDSGIGISQDNLEHIFNSFAQADSSTTRKFGGTGLGLSISKHLVELMNGQISVKSIIDEGTIFTFTIFLKPFVDELASEENVLDLSEVSFNCSSKILLVEDNKTNQMLLKMMLLDLNLSCDIAENGLEAFEKVQEKEYDLVLMDENMPVMNGIESTKKIRELNIDVPIVAVTANALKGDREKFLSAGMNDYLSKPIDNDEFITILHKYV